MQQIKSKFKIFLDSLERKGFFRGARYPETLVDIWFVVFISVFGLELFLGLIVSKIFNLNIATITTGFRQLDLVAAVLFVGIAAASAIIVCRVARKRGTYEYYEVLDESVVMKDFFIFILAGGQLWLGIAALSLRERLWGTVFLLFAVGMLIFNFKNASLSEVLRRVVRMLMIVVSIIIFVAFISFIIINLIRIFA